MYNCIIQAINIIVYGVCLYVCIHIFIVCVCVCVCVIVHGF